MAEGVMSPEEIAHYDAAYWAQFYKVRLQAGTFSFKGHEYQLEPMQSRARRKCYMKGTQLGVTELESLVSIHGLIQRLYRLGVLYMFPTNDNVLDFSRSRFNPLIGNNKEVIGRFVKTGGKGTDTAGLKKIGDGFLYFRGARLSTSVGLGGLEEKESVSLRSIPVDRVVFDEVDLMDEEVVAKARGRMGHSERKEEVYLSNPTIPEYGIDALFARSDQRHWFRRCGCGRWMCAEEEFPNCVKRRDDGSGYVGCAKCGAEVRVWAGAGTGEWVPRVRENTAYMQGWRMSQLLSSFVDPWDIVEEFNDPPQGNLSDVYRLRLGLPHVPEEDRLTAETVLGRCGQDMMPTKFPGPAAMGVDVGKVKHVVIGIRTGAETYEVLKVAQVTRWGDLHDLAERYGVKSAVVDVRPYEDEARAFQKAEPYLVYLCEYAEKTPAGPAWNDETGIVRAGRTEAFDGSHRAVTEGRLILPRRCPDVETFARQMAGCAKVLDTNRKTGISVYRYVRTGGDGDHYRNAANYFLLAAQHVARADPHGRKPKARQAVALNTYRRL